MRDRGQAIENENEELRARLNEVKQELLSEQEENRDEYISELEEYYEDLISLDESHIAALKQASQDDNEYYESQIQDLKNEIQEYRDLDERSREEVKWVYGLLDERTSQIKTLVNEAKDARSQILALKDEKNHFKLEAEILTKEKGCYTEKSDIYRFVLPARRGRGVGGGERCNP